MRLSMITSWMPHCFGKTANWGSSVGAGTVVDGGGVVDDARGPVQVGKRNHPIGKS